SSDGPALTAGAGDPPWRSAYPRPSRRAVLVATVLAARTVPISMAVTVAVVTVSVPSVPIAAVSVRVAIAVPVVAVRIPIAVSIWISPAPAPPPWKAEIADEDDIIVTVMTPISIPVAAVPIAA